MHKLLLVFFIFFIRTATAEWPRHTIDGSLRGADGVKLGDVNTDGLFDIVTGWEESGETRLYLNPGENVTAAWPFVSVGQTPSVEDAVIVDLDRDGNMDIVTCCEGEKKSIYVHWNLGQDVMMSGNWRRELLPASQGKMQWMFCMPLDMDSDGDTDLIAAGKNDNAEIGWFETPANPHSLDNAVWHSLASVGWVMSILTTDMDADGDVDVVYSDRKGRQSGCFWLENPGAESGIKWPVHHIGGAGKEVMFLTIADYDADGLDDILVAVKPRSILLCRRLDRNGMTWREKTFKFPPHTGTAKAVAAADFNLDGRMDMAVTCEAATPPLNGVFILSSDQLNNDLAFLNVSGETGIKFDRMEILDIDSDGDVDILTCEERHNNRGLGIIWYENPARSF